MVLSSHLLKCHINCSDCINLILDEKQKVMKEKSLNTGSGIYEDYFVEKSSNLYVYKKNKLVKNSAEMSD